MANTEKKKVRTFCVYGDNPSSLVSDYYWEMI